MTKASLAPFMLLIAEDGNQSPWSDLWKLDPGAATTEAFLHGESDCWLQAIDADKGDMDAFPPERPRLPPLTCIVFKPLLNH